MLRLFGAVFRNVFHGFALGLSEFVALSFFLLITGYVAGTQVSAAQSGSGPLAVLAARIDTFSSGVASGGIGAAIQDVFPTGGLGTSSNAIGIVDPSPNVSATSSATAIPPTPTPDSPQLASLKSYALGLINADRKAFGAPPVTLGNDASAQAHASDMLQNFYLAHWDTGGYKPYMRYTQDGGLGYMAENAAYSGWFDPTVPSWHYRNQSADQAIHDLEYAMMYNDADSNWGHRDTIINPDFQQVSIGIAYDGKRLAFIEHFSANRVDFTQPPTLVDGQFSMAGTLTSDAGALTGIQVYYDAPPQPLTSAELNAKPRHYSIGEGPPVANIVPPSPIGSHYTNLQPIDVVADSWGRGQQFNVSADLSSFTNRPGVYTVVAWGSGLDNTPLTSISLFKGTN